MLSNVPKKFYSFQNFEKIIDITYTTIICYITRKVLMNHLRKPVPSKLYVLIPFHSEKVYGNYIFKLSNHLLKIL